MLKNKPQYKDILSSYLCEHSIKHKDFANRVGISESSISFYIRGLRVPNPRTAMKIEKESNGIVPKEGIFNATSDHKSYKSKRVNGRPLLIHHLVWTETNGTIPVGYVVHHNDGDIHNNDISNLILMTKSDHRRIHAGWLRNDVGIWTHRLCYKCKKIKPLDQFYKYGDRYFGTCKHCYRDNRR